MRGGFDGLLLCIEWCRRLVALAFAFPPEQDQTPKHRYDLTPLPAANDHLDYIGRPNVEVPLKIAPLRYQRLGKRDDLFPGIAFRTSSKRRRSFRKRAGLPRKHRLFQRPVRIA